MWVGLYKTHQLKKPICTWEVREESGTTVSLTTGHTFQNNSQLLHVFPSPPHQILAANGSFCHLAAGDSVPWGWILQCPNIARAGLTLECNEVNEGGGMEGGR